jgi:hypothetical protein
MSKEFKYKTKTVNKNGRDVHMMICSNSNPEHSKYARFAPEGGCDEWVATNPDTTKVLCWRCVQRSLSNSPIEKIED